MASVQEVFLDRRHGMQNRPQKNGKMVNEEWERFWVLARRRREIRLVSEKQPRKKASFQILVLLACAQMYEAANVFRSLQVVTILCGTWATPPMLSDSIPYQLLNVAASSGDRQLISGVPPYKYQLFTNEH
ncbi:hypothetical protein DFJ58DRAFT_845678 [Suillus subalutaceus]|uniref:uncharacterized protein n=1 Tax=Suillus subalutaceus TaxID=48586 RepID=UPI001B85DF9A|nr:uncharacterized protein DFJ58DRAFT_845678 [Suillus subalutaceus]KAG1839571.1 hypothetical protein DFJ58DRAFT_845678 [Suillus subalutaceus]